jgi:hypothetical protein
MFPLGIDNLDYRDKRSTAVDQSIEHFGENQLAWTRNERRLDFAV